jgi:hypothetical protein
MKNILIITITVVLLASCQHTTTPSQNIDEATKAPPTWKSAKFYNFFSFSIPPSLDSQKVLGYDSYVGRFSNDSMVLDIDYGLYSASFGSETGMPMYRDTTMQISGQMAKEVFYYDPGNDSSRPFLAGIYFAHVDNSTSNKLSIEVFCKTGTLQDTARIIFSTIKFN